MSQDTFMGADSVNIRPLFLKKENMSGKKYFYGLGQSARARGMTKLVAEKFYRLDCALPYAQIYFDKGFRGLSL